MRAQAKRIGSIGVEKAEGAELSGDALRRQKQNEESAFEQHLSQMSGEDRQLALEKRAAEKRQQFRTEQERIERAQDIRIQAAASGEGLAGKTLAEGLASDDDIARVTSLVHVMEEYKAAEAAIAQAKQDNANAEAEYAKAMAASGMTESGAYDTKAKNEADAKRTEANQHEINARQRAAQAEALLKKNGVSTDNIAPALQEAKSYLDERKKQAQGAAQESDELQRRAQQHAIELAKANAEAVIDGKRSALALEDETLDSIQRGFELEREKLALEKSLSDEQRKSRAQQIDDAEKLAEAQLQLKESMGHLDIDAAALEIQDESLARSLAQLDIERKRLELKRQMPGANQEELNSQAEVINKQEAALRRRADLLAKQATLQYQANRAGLESKSAMFGGDYRGAILAKQRAELAEDRIAANAAKEQARQMTDDPQKQTNYVASQIAARRHARQLERAEVTRDASEDRRLSMLNSLSQLAQAAGNKFAARQYRRQAGKLEDQREERSLLQKLLEGGVDEGTARRMAKQQTRQSVLMRRAEEQGIDGPERFMRGEAVASSMRRIGGGGNFYGSGDSVPRKIDKTNQLLTQIRDAAANGDGPIIY